MESGHPVQGDILQVIPRRSPSGGPPSEGGGTGSLRISLPPARRKTLKRIVFGALGCLRLDPRRGGHRAHAAAQRGGHAGRCSNGRDPCSAAGRRPREPAGRRAFPRPCRRRAADRHVAPAAARDAGQGLARWPEDQRRVSDGCLRRSPDQDRPRQGALGQHPLRRRPQDRQVAATVPSSHVVAHARRRSSLPAGARAHAWALELDAVLCAVAPPAPAEVGGGDGRDHGRDGADRNTQDDGGRC
jgi:hypothetical protein